MTTTDDTGGAGSGRTIRPPHAGGPTPSQQRPDVPAAVVDCAIYVDGHREPPVEPVASLERARELGGFVWLGLYEPSEAEFATFADRYGLHPLAVEDAVNAYQRPKLERYDESLFLVLKTARYVEHEELTATSEVVDTGEVMIFLGADYVITVRHGEHSGLQGLRAHMEGQPDLLRQGPSSVLYAIADLVVDHFIEVVAAVEEDVEELEASVFSPDRTDDIGRIYQLKRELMQLRRSLNPLEAPLTVLAERQIDLVPGDMRSYFRDVQDHAVRVREQLASYDELLASILQASLARTSLADNEDMRKISAYAGIIAVPTAIAGIYGMNFDHMPELHWTLGYPMALTVMLVACVLLYRGFKRSGWL